MTKVTISKNNRNPTISITENNRTITISKNPKPLTVQINNSLRGFKGEKGDSGDGGISAVDIVDLISKDEPNDLKLGTDEKLLSQPPDVDFLAYYILNNN